MTLRLTIEGPPGTGKETIAHTFAYMFQTSFGLNLDFKQAKNVFVNSENNKLTEEQLKNIDVLIITKHSSL